MLPVPTPTFLQIRGTTHTHTHTHTQASYLSTAWEHLLVMVVVVYNLIV